MKILVALDDSKCSFDALAAIIAQARAKNAEVLVLHVVEPFPAKLAEEISNQGSLDFVAARVEQRQRAKELLARAEDELRSAGFKVMGLVEEGDARSVILDRANAWHADLIVLGSHGRTGLNRFLMGSVSEAVTHHALCSVEIVRNPAIN